MLSAARSMALVNTAGQGPLGSGIGRVSTGALGVTGVNRLKPPSDIGMKPIEKTGWAGGFEPPYGGISFRCYRHRHLAFAAASDASTRDYRGRRRRRAGLYLAPLGVTSCRVEQIASDRRPHTARPCWPAPHPCRPASPVDLFQPGCGALRPKSQHNHQRWPSLANSARCCPGCCPEPYRILCANPEIRL